MNLKILLDVLCTEDILIANESRGWAPTWRSFSMCRNIKTLYNFAPPATDEEILCSFAAVREEGNRLQQAVQDERGGLLLRGRRYRGSRRACSPRSKPPHRPRTGKKRRPRRKRASASKVRRAIISTTLPENGQEVGRDLQAQTLRRLTSRALPRWYLVESSASAEPPPCQGDQHNRQRTKAAQDRQEAVVAQDGSGKERSQDPSNRPIKARVNQDGHKHAAFGVVEDPRVHDGQAGGRKDKHHDVECSEFIPRREEQGQVPQAPRGHRGSGSREEDRAADCSRGSANPRQPGSSPSAPPRKST